MHWSDWLDVVKTLFLFAVLFPVLAGVVILVWRVMFWFVGLLVGIIRSVA